MTDEMPDSIERPHIFALIEHRYRNSACRAADLEVLEKDLADPHANLIDTRERLLRKVIGSSGDAELQHVRDHWYGNGWYWDFLPAEVGPLPDQPEIPADVVDDIKAARQKAIRTIRLALDRTRGTLNEYQRASILQLMTGEESPVSGSRPIDGKARARVFARGLVEFISQIDRIVDRTGCEPELQVRWVCEGKPNQFEAYVDWSPRHVTLTVLTPKVVKSGAISVSSSTPAEERGHDRGTLIVRASTDYDAPAATYVSTPRLYQLG